MIRRGALALLASAVVLVATVDRSAASFVAVSSNPGNTTGTLNVRPPSSATAASQIAGGVHLAWSGSPTDPGVGHTLTYLVLRAPQGGMFSEIGSTAASVLAFDDTPPADGAYSYLVRAKVSGVGSFTSTTGATVSAISDRTATPPTGLIITPGTKGSPATLRLSWTAANDALSGIQGYEIRWTDIVTSCPTASTANYPNATTVGPVTSAAVPPTGTLVNGAKYCIYIVTIDGLGNVSAPSAVAGPTAAK